MTNQQGAPEALRVEAAYGGDGKFIGYRLLSSGAPGGLLVWADQTVMSGFRIGDHFVPDYQEVIEYKPVALVEAQQPADCGNTPYDEGPFTLAQQPAPSAAAAPVAVKTMGYGGSTGINDYLMSDGTVKAMRPAEVKWAPQPSTTPQADSQPAPGLDYPPLPDLISSVWPFIHTNAAADSAAMVAKTSDQVDAAIHTLLRAYVDADRAARAPADSVTAPAGWKLVPVEPSVDQEWEGKEASRRVDSMAEARKIYKAMLAAAPTPPAQAADSVLEDAALPMQPICIASDGVIRFKQNRMVNDVYEFSQPRGFGLNEMARRDYTQEERMQFAQLIGYSVSGYGGLSYASPESAEKADAIADSLIAARKQGGA